MPIDPTMQPQGDRPLLSAADVASRIIEHADRDVAFIVRLVGDSLHLIVEHFHVFIERELASNGVGYGDHPLLRPFIETHARELAEFVVTGIGLAHRFTLQEFEKTRGDPLRLLRVDLWDNLRSHIEHGERQFVTGPHGLKAILEEVKAIQHLQTSGSKHA